MRSAIIVLFLVTAIATAALGGDKPAIHLTGNPSVDFFASIRTLPMSGSAQLDTTLTAPSFSGGEEKSPALAGVLSLALPGLGEAYSQTYVKAIAFAAVEVTSWIVAYTYNRKGDRQTDDFERYANLHWNASKYANWVLNNLSVLDPSQAGNQVDWGDKIYPDGYDPNDPPRDVPPYHNMSWPQLNALEDNVRSVPDNGFSHLLPTYNDQQYYELIGKYDQFSRGWDDAPDDILSTSDLPVKSNSQRFYQYALMRAQANNYYDVAGTFVSVAVINHIVSAIDAFWSASKFNSNLHAEVKVRVQPTMFGVAPVTEAKFRYDF